MACASHVLQSIPQPETVSVNGVAISRDAIAREVQHHKASKPIEAWQSAARALVIRELLLQRVRCLGIASSPRDNGGGRRETDEEALLRALIEEEVATPDPDEVACRRISSRTGGASGRSRFMRRPISSLPRSRLKRKATRERESWQIRCSRN